MTKMKKTVLLTALLLTGIAASAQQTLTLDDCQQMAVQQSKDLEQARTQIKMASYDRKIALANYFPSVSATGAYLYNSRDIALIGDAQSQMLQNAGTLVQWQLDAAMAGAAQQLSAGMTQSMTQLMTAIQTNPALAAEYMGTPMWQTVLKMLQGVDPSSLAGLVPNIAEPVNAIGGRMGRRSRVARLACREDVPVQGLFDPQAQRVVLRPRAPPRAGQADHHRRRGHYA